MPPEKLALSTRLVRLSAVSLGHRRPCFVPLSGGSCFVASQNEFRQRVGEMDRALKEARQQLQAETENSQQRIRNLAETKGALAETLREKVREPRSETRRRLGRHAGVGFWDAAGGAGRAAPGRAGGS